MRCTAPALFLAVLACSDDDGSDDDGAGVKRSQFVDQGALCVGTDPDGDLSVQVTVNDCGSGCAQVVGATCAIDVGNGELVVHSTVEAEEPRGGDLVSV